MIYAGLRIEETTALTLEDLSFTRGEEEVRVARGKGNKERVVPMSPKLKRSLKRYLARIIHGPSRRGLAIAVDRDGQRPDAASPE
jgi:site-specific recombinase XerD